MYQYLHTNGQIINKPDGVMWNTRPEDYFDNDFVVCWWHIDDETGETDARGC